MSNTNGLLKIGAFVAVVVLGFWFYGTESETAQTTGWEFAEWGMSPEEVADASDGQAVDSRGDVDWADPAENMVENDYYGLDAKSYFVYKDRGLSIVFVHIENQSRCDELPKVLTDHYGEHDSVLEIGFGKTYFWDDEAAQLNKRDHEDHNVPRKCSVMYYAPWEQFDLKDKS